MTNQQHILSPEMPNRATALFGGQFSGILNWNDVQFEELYKHRERIRSHFWSKSEIDADENTMCNLESEQALIKINRLIKFILDTHMDQRMNNSLISSFATDPTIISIISTINDASNERYLASMYLSITSPDVIFEEVDAKHMGIIKSVEEDVTPEDIAKALSSLYNNTRKIKQLVEESYTDISKGPEKTYLDMVTMPTDDIMNFVEFVISHMEIQMPQYNIRKAFDEFTDKYE